MDRIDNGRVPEAPGSHASDQAAARLDAARVDPSREVFGIECEHHYGITTHPLPKHGDIAKEVYRLIREAWHAPQENGGGLHDGDHAWKFVEATGERWSRIEIRKNDLSPLFAFKPWWCEDGPGALWFTQAFRIATRETIDREIADNRRWRVQWQKTAVAQKDTIRGRAARAKYSALAAKTDLEEQAIRSRWPEYDGTLRSAWQKQMHCHCDRDASLAEDAQRLSPEGVAARAEGIAPNPSGDSWHRHHPR